MGAVATDIDTICRLIWGQPTFNILDAIPTGQDVWMGQVEAGIQNGYLDGRCSRGVFDNLLVGELVAYHKIVGMSTSSRRNRRRTRLATSDLKDNNCQVLAFVEGQKRFKLTRLGDTRSVLSRQTILRIPVVKHCLIDLMGLVLGLQFPASSTSVVAWTLVCPPRQGLVG